MTEQLAMYSSDETDQYRLFIASPLEVEHVERIREVDLKRIHVVYEPDLLPPTRYVADHKGIPSFQHTPDQFDRWRREISSADILFDFPCVSSQNGDWTSWVSNLKWIQTTSSGVGQHVARLGLHTSDLLITTARGVHAGPLAEFVFLSLLSHAKRLDHLREEQSARRWDRFCGDELDGRTIGIIGAGQVGSRTAAIARCFGMKVVVLASPGSTKKREDYGADELFQAGELHKMLSSVDFVVLAVPHTPDTEGMIDAAAIAAMKPGCVLVNIARGKVVVEEAMLAALQSGHIACAALDVFQTEPLPEASPLWGMNNVLVSPHSASTSFSENRKIVDMFCHNIRCFVDRRYDQMKNVLDKKRLY